MIYALPPSYQKPHKPIPHNCSTCGDRKCRRKWRVHCWTKCPDWKPEVLSLDKLPKEPEGENGHD